MTSDIRSRAERLARLLEEQAEIAAQISELKAEAKSDGYDPALLMKTARLLAMDAEKRRKQLDQHELFDTYLSAVGLVAERVDSEPQPEPEPTTREERSKARLSEAMADHKAFSAELAAAGLISPEAHAENLVLSDKVAAKYGAGVIPDTPVPATPIRRDEEPEMPAFLRRSKPVASEITA